MTNSNFIEIIGYRLGTINFFPKTRFEEIIQNVRIILTTVVGSVPLDRAFGLSVGFIDDPEPRGMMKLRIFTLESIQEYEPRVEVTEVDFVPDINSALDGRLYPKVKVRIPNEHLA